MVGKTLRHLKAGFFTSHYKLLGSRAQEARPRQKTEKCERADVLLLPEETG